MVATEIANLKLREALQLDDPTHETSKHLLAAGELISSQPGALTSHHGAVIERPTELQLYIDWDAVSSHTAFTKSPQYATLGTHLQPILAAAPTYNHFTFNSAPALSEVLSAPVTENVSLYVPASTKRADFDGRLEKFEAVLRPHATGAHGFAWGWSEEEVEHEKFGADKGRIVKVLVGWDAVESHMAFRETEAFAGAIGLLRDGTVGSEMFHTKVRKG